MSADAARRADAAQFDEVPQARLGLAVGVGLEQLVGAEVGLEGQPGEGAKASRKRDGAGTSTVLLEVAHGDGGRWRFGGGVVGLDPGGRAGAPDGGVGVGVEDGGLAGGLAVVEDLQRPPGGRLRIVPEDDGLADEDGVGLVEATVEADGVAPLCVRSWNGLGSRSVMCLATCWRSSWRRARSESG